MISEAKRKEKEFHEAIDEFVLKFSDELKASVKQTFGVDNLKVFIARRNRKIPLSQEEFTNNYFPVWSYVLKKENNRIDVLREILQTPIFGGKSFIAPSFYEQLAKPWAVQELELYFSEIKEKSNNTSLEKGKKQIAFIKTIEKAKLFHDFQESEINNAISCIFPIRLGIYIFAIVYVTFIPTVNDNDKMAEVINLLRENDEDEKKIEFVIILGRLAHSLGMGLLNCIMNLFLKYYLTTSKTELMNILFSEYLSMGGIGITKQYEEIKEIKQFIVVKINNEKTRSARFIRIPYPIEDWIPKPIPKKYYELSINEIKSVVDTFNNFYDEIMKIQKNLIIKNAAVSIIVDSFAHNIVAHSLASLIELFRKRKEYWTDKAIFCEKEKADSNYIPDIENIKDIVGVPLYKNAGGGYVSLKYLGLIKTQLDVFYNQLSKIKRKYLVYLVPIDDYIHSFLRYIEGKASLWNGIIRQVFVGGEITNWYAILLEFVNNPLFIGTIAGTEGIYKIKFKVNRKDFVTVDIKDFIRAFQNEVEFTKKDYNFVEPENGFDDIKNEFKDKEVLLPGGAIGKHALYTIFENIIRNVKYCKKKVQGEKRIDFNIGIDARDGKTYLIRCWLDNRSEIYDSLDKRKKVSNSMNKEAGMYLVDENGLPRMGGIQQTKICSSFLFTNDFIKFIENKQITYNRKVIYPFTKYYSQNEVDKKCEIVTEFRIWRGEKKYEKTVTKAKGDLEPETGLIIKENKFIYENIRRFKILVAKKNDERKKVEEMGIVRAIVTSENKNFEACYKKWLDEWLGSNVSEKIIKKGLDVAEHTINFWKLDFHTWEWKKEMQSQHIEDCIELIHRPPKEKANQLLIRNHGTLVQKFYKDKEKNLFKVKEYGYEVAETFFTSVVIIDNRIHQPLSKYLEKTNNSDALWNCLKLRTYPEENKCWNKLEKEIKEEVHFLVIHLGFIETSTEYNEETIENFVTKFLNQKVKYKKLVITTGRGRSLWYQKIRESGLSAKVMFIPPESIVSAISHGITISDDFEIKYGIIKVLMGS